MAHPYYVNGSHGRQQRKMDTLNAHSDYVIKNYERQRRRMDTLIAHPHCNEKYERQRYRHHPSFPDAVHHAHLRVSAGPHHAARHERAMLKRVADRNKENAIKHVALPGVEKILSPSPGKIKALWMVAVVLLYGLCVYQLSDRIQVYLSRPIALQQSVVNYRSVNFPALTVCPSSNLKSLQNACRSLTNGTLEKCRFADFDTSLDKIWKTITINQSSINITVSCTKASEADGCEDHPTQKQRSLATFFGTCITLTLVNNVTYRGAETYFKVEITDGSDEDPVMFVFHPKHIIPLHEAMRRYKTVNPGYIVDVRFHYKQMNFLNTRRNPCVKASASVDCTNECINKYFDRNVPCRLPFMVNTTKEACPTYQKTVNAINMVKDAYMEYSCDCPRGCTNTLVEYSFDSFKSTDSHITALTLRFPDNIVEVVTEQYTYALSGLLSDVGGSLGFCVGLCLFSFIEVIEYVFKRLVKMFMRGQEYPHTKHIRPHNVVNYKA